MFELTNENLARLLKGLTIAVGNRRNRIVFYQFLAAEIRALHYSYGVGDSESYKRALAFLQECERFTLRSLVRKSAERHVEVTVEHAKSILFRALEKLNASRAVRGPTPGRAIIERQGSVPVFATLASRLGIPSNQGGS